MLPPHLSHKPKRRSPGLFDATLGALAGAVTGGVLGLFAVGIYPTIVAHDITHLFRYPLLSVISCLICAPVSWILGWLIGPQLGRRFNSPKTEIIAGVVAGLVPVAGVILWAASRQ